MFPGDNIEATTPLRSIVRPFKRKDLRGVLSIERQCFTEPWSQNMFEALYQISPKGFYVAVINENIVGYAIMLMERGWRGFSRYRRGHLMNIAVHPRLRNQGIGRCLVDAIISEIERKGGEEIYLEVRASNTNAFAFYKKLGFERRGIIKGFYKNEDAVVMAKKVKN